MTIRLEREARMTVRGSCHCGGVRITVPQAPEWVGSCNRSLCRKTGRLVAYAVSLAAQFS
jgi:hypothetical protein